MTGNDTRADARVLQVRCRRMTGTDTRADAGVLQRMALAAASAPASTKVTIAP